MVTAKENPTRQTATLTITWEKLPDDFKLEEKPVENTGQPLIAGALRESLELAGLIKPEMLIASNFGLCATVNGDLVIKAPDWVYVASVLPKEQRKDRKSYTPNLEGDVPTIVMEFLSDTDGEEYSVKRTFPPGKWFFYERILQVPTYAIFAPDTGLLELYRLQDGRYELEIPDADGRHCMADLKLFLGVWRGEKEQRQGYWLRWWDEAGNLLPWAVEQIEQERQRMEQERQRAEQERQRAEQERQRAEQERQRAEQERQRAERLAEILRSQGINPDDLE
jgi:Putative restriction endonuclease